METGKLIKDLRIKKGMTQEELAEKTDLSTRTIQRIENGEVDPRTYSLQMIAKALEVEYSIFIEEESEEAQEEKARNDRFVKGMLHLSGILPLFFPSILFYYHKKKKVKGMADHFHNIIILQLLVLFIIIPGIILYYFFEINGFINKVPMMVLIGIIIEALFSIGNAIKVFNEKPYKSFNFNTSKN